MITLAIQPKNTFKKVADARAQGLIPVVYYGSHTQSTAGFTVLGAFQKVLKEAGESTIITLDTGAEKIQALIHEVQLDPVTSKPSHVDFKTVSANEAVEVPVHLVFEGVSPAVKAGATLVKVLHEVTVEALPANLPHELVVDISKLVSNDDVIYVRDLVLPKGVTVVGHADDVIASVSVGVEEDLSAPVAALDLDAIEVEKKGKKEEEEAAE
jgi:large subunit ribosomal protein L25